MLSPTLVETAPSGLLAPLHTPLFRRMWLASVQSNLGFLFLSVGAAWQMTALTPKADMVALVQTALMLPMTFLSIPAGAIADMYDRRKIGIASLWLSIGSAALLAALTFLGFASPWMLLGFCALMGLGMSLFNPAWQASVSEQVPRDILPQAVALNAISFNIARSFGPAVGGVIVAMAGAVVAFAATAVSYLPILVVMLRWRRLPVPSRLPPERMDRAVSAGIRYVVHSPQIRIVLIRTFVVGYCGASASALMPLVTRDLLHGSAEIYGLMLGCYGVGAVVGAVNLSRIRRALSDEAVISLSALVMAASFLLVALSPYPGLTGIGLIAGGTAWMIALTLFNVLVQTSAPRWVSGRLLAAYQTSIAGGIALGSWFWGHLAELFNVQHALFVSVSFLAASSLLGFVLRMPSISEADLDPVKLSDPEVNLDLTGRSGPIVVQLEYRVPMTQARDFYRKIMAIQSIRSRNGAFGWSLSRDIADPELWVERFQCPTWHDYLRQRDRNTPDDLDLLEQARAYLKDGHDMQVRRLLERPFGSVRWTEDAPET